MSLDRIRGGRLCLAVAAIGYLMLASRGLPAQTPERQWVPQQTPTIERQAQREGQRSNRPTDPPPVPVRIVKSPDEAKHDKAQEAKADEREAHDLEAQIRAAAAAEDQARASWWTVFLSGAATVFLVWTLYETRKANAISRETYIAEQRPWLTISPSIESDVCFYEKMAMGKVRITVTNLGRTPAENIFVYETVTTKFGDFTTWAEDHAVYTLMFRDGMRSGHDRDALFPGESLELVRDFKIGTSEVERSPHATRDGRRYIPLNLLIGVTYNFEFSKLPPVTSRAYRLLVAGGIPPNAIFPDQGRIDAGKLRFEPCMGSFIR